MSDPLDYKEGRGDYYRASAPPEVPRTEAALDLLGRMIAGNPAEWPSPWDIQRALVAIEREAAAPSEPPRLDMRALLAELVELEDGPRGSCAMCGQEGEGHMTHCLVQRAKDALSRSTTPQSEPHERDVAAPQGQPLDVERVRQTIANLRDQWSGEDDPAEAFVAEYTRLSGSGSPTPPAVARTPSGFRFVVAPTPPGEDRP